MMININTRIENQKIYGKEKEIFFYTETQNYFDKF